MFPPFRRRVELSEGDVAGLLLVAIVVGFAYHAAGFRTAAELAGVGLFWGGLLSLYNPVPDVDRDELGRRFRFKYGFLPIVLAFAVDEVLHYFGVAPTSLLVGGIEIGLLWWAIVFGIARWT